MHPSSICRVGSLPLTIVCAALLAACGGGGGDAGTSSGAAADDSTSAAANASLVPGDATATLDSGLAAAQSVVAVQATASASPTLATAQSAHAEGSATPNAVANVPVACPGGGSATLTITGGSVASVLNGRFDADEVYQISFVDCRSAGGAAAVNGSLAITVLAATATTTSLSSTSSNLTTTTARGTVTLNGSSAVEWASNLDASGTGQSSSHVTSSGITLGTKFNGRSSSFTLGAVDIQRTNTWMNGAVQSSTLQGTHTLSGELTNGSFTHTVSTQGSVTYSAEGVPAAGAYAISLPASLIGVSFASGSVTITVDRGKDGTIDRRVTLPLAELESAAG